MANRPHVPKFGDWTEDAPLTVVFEKASRSRKNINATTSNPNDHQYPEMNPNSSQTRNNRHDQYMPTPNNNNVRSRHERLSSREETEFRSSPAHHQRNDRVRAPPPTTVESYNNHQYGGGGGGRSYGIPAETTRRPLQDPSPVQRPIRNLRGRSSERVASIPPFPISGSENQSYTLIFDKVKEERHQNVRSYNGTAQSTPSQPINEQRHQPIPSSPKGCCFPWSRK